MKGSFAPVHGLWGLCFVLSVYATAMAQTEPAKPEGEKKPAEAKPAEPKPAPAVANPRVKMETTLGSIVLELDAQKAPISVENFMQYVRGKFYDGTIFHRIVPTFMIQGGGFLPDLTEKSAGIRESIKNESENGLKNVRGSIAMARRNDPNSATCQFFINVVDNARLDGAPNRPGYSVFGRVVEGMETVDKIKGTETKTDPKFPEPNTVPVTPVVIQSVTVLETASGSKP